MTSLELVTRDLSERKDRTQQVHLGNGTLFQTEETEETHDIDYERNRNITRNGHLRNSVQSLTFSRSTNDISRPKPPPNRPHGPFLLVSGSPKDEQHASLDHSEDSLQRRRSERSLSSTSDSKPDVVKCTRKKISHKSSNSAYRNSYCSVTELNDQDTALESQEHNSRKRWHSAGDDLDLSDLEHTDATAEVNAA